MQSLDDYRDALIREAIIATKDPLWMTEDTRRFWDEYTRRGGKRGGAARAVGYGEKPDPDFDLLDYSSMAPGVGDITGPMADIRYYAQDPEKLTPTNLGISMLGLLPLIGSLRGIKATAHAMPQWHGTMSAESGGSEVLDPSVILREGFTRGASSEMKTPGTSTSEDILTSLRAFTPDSNVGAGFDWERRGDPNYLIRVKNTADPEKVWNLPPDLYGMGVAPGTRGDQYRKPNVFNEAETFSTRKPIWESPDPAIRMEKNYYNDKDAVSLISHEISNLGKDLDSVTSDELWDYLKSKNVSDDLAREIMAASEKAPFADVWNQVKYAYYQGAPKDTLAVLHQGNMFKDSDVSVAGLTPGATKGMTKADIDKAVEDIKEWDWNVETAALDKMVKDNTLKANLLKDGIHPAIAEGIQKEIDNGNNIDDAIDIVADRFKDATGPSGSSLTPGATPIRAGTGVNNMPEGMTREDIDNALFNAQEWSWHKDADIQDELINSGNFMKSLEEADVHPTIAEAIKKEVDKGIDISDAVDNVTSRFKNVTEPSAFPLTPQEQGWANRSLDAMNRFDATYNDMLYGQGNPKAFVTALNGMKGYKGTYKKVMDLLARQIGWDEAGSGARHTFLRNIENSYGFDARMAISDALKDMEQKRSAYAVAMGRLRDNPMIPGHGMKLDEIYEQVKGGKSLNDFGYLPVRDLYRDYTKARENAHKVLNDVVFKTARDR